MTAEHLVVACWLIFVVVWIVFAIGRKESAQRQGMVERVSYLFPLAVGSGLIFKGFSHTPYPGNLGDILLPVSQVTTMTGLAIACLGLWIAIWARRALGRNWSASVVVKYDHELVTSGPYAWVRHPIYTGFELMFLGSALVLGTRAAFIGFVLTLLSCWLKLRQEDAVMRKQFPDAYPAYQTRTKRLIPFIW